MRARAHSGPKRVPMHDSSSRRCVRDVTGTLAQNLGGWKSYMGGVIIYERELSNKHPVAHTLPTSARGGGLMSVSLPSERYHITTDRYWQPVEHEVKKISWVKHGQGTHGCCQVRKYGTKNITIYVWDPIILLSLS